MAIDETTAATGRTVTADQRRRRMAVTNTIRRAGDAATVPVWKRRDGWEVRSPCCGAATRVPLRHPNGRVVNVGDQLRVQCGKPLSMPKGNSETGGCRAIYEVVLGDGDAVWEFSGRFDGR